MNIWHKGSICPLDAWREVQVRWMFPHHWNRADREGWWVTAAVWRKEGMSVESRDKGGEGEEERGGKEIRWKVEERKQQAVLWIFYMLFVAGSIDLGGYLCDPIDLTLGLHLSLIFQHHLIIMSVSKFNWSIILAQSLAGFTSLELGQVLNKKWTSFASWN